MQVIRNIDDGVRFWNKYSGWVPFRDATVYSDREVGSQPLPERGAWHGFDEMIEYFHRSAFNLGMTFTFSHITGRWRWFNKNNPHESSGEFKTHFDCLLDSVKEFNRVV